MHICHFYADSLINIYLFNNAVFRYQYFHSEISCIVSPKGYFDNLTNKSELLTPMTLRLLAMEGRRIILHLRTKIDD